MSIETTINGIINDARSLAASTTTAANALVAAASAVLQYLPDYPRHNARIRDAGFSIGRAGDPDVAEKVPSFPSIRQAQLPDSPKLVDLDEIKREFAERAPTITLPSQRYSYPSALEPFAKTEPVIDTSIILPKRPETLFPSRPNLLDINTSISGDPLSVPVLTITRPTYEARILDDWGSEFETGLSKLPNFEEYAFRVLNKLFPNLQSNMLALAERVNGILEGRTTALTDRSDQALYDSLRARLALEREKNLQVIDDSYTVGGWGLPSGARMAALLRMETEASRAANAAALEVYVKRADRELQHLQFTMELANRLNSSGMDLFVKALGLNFESFRSAIAYAEAATRYSATAYELLQKDFAIRSQVMETEVKWFEALLRAELAKAEVTKTNLELERLKTDVNQQLIQQYLAELKENETQANIYATEVSALRSELELRRFPLDIYENQIKAYTAMVEAKRAEYLALQAEIDGDKAKIDGQLAKVRAYETQAQAFRTLVDADSAKIEAQAKRNESVLEEFKTRIQTEVSLTQIDESIAKHALTAYDAMSRIYLAQASHDLEEARFEYFTRLENAKLELETLRIEHEQEIKNIEIELSRRKTLGDMQMAGASVQGQLAGSALSALNSVVSLAASTEEATA